MPNNLVTLPLFTGLLPLAVGFQVLDSAARRSKGLPEDSSDHFLCSLTTGGTTHFGAKRRSHCAESWASQAERVERS